MSDSHLTATPTNDRALVAPELHFDLNAETQDLRGSSLWQQGKHTARTLVMHPDFRVLLIDMPQGSRLKPHQTAQRISVHVLSGHVTLTVPAGPLPVVSGGLVVLDKAIVHDVFAVENSTVLLSLSGTPAHPHGQGHPLDALSRDHKRFGRLLDLISEQIEKFQLGKQPDYDVLRDIFEYMTNYPDRLHHPHEDAIFARIVLRVPASRLHVESMIQQHKDIAQSGARFLRRLQSAFDGVVLLREAVTQPAVDYVNLYREHLRIEEQEVFPLCREHLQQEDWDSLAASFQVEKDPLAHNPTEGKYRALHRQMMALLESPDHVA